jgi:hypothetical protein
MSDPAVLKALKRSFVPVALNLYEIKKEKGPGGDFWRNVQKQRPELYQGLFVVSPEGKVLASHGKMVEPDRKWSAEVLDTFDAALKKFGRVTARTPAERDDLADRGLGKRKDGGIALVVYMRPMVLGLVKKGIGDLAVDSVLLTKEEAGNFSLPAAREGEKWSIPARIVRKLHKVLSPVSDANTMPRADEVKVAQLSGKVEKVISGVAYLRFSGKISGIHIWEFDPHKGKKIHAEATLEGVGTCIAKTGELTRVVIVAKGTYRNYPPYDEPMKYGAVIDWRLKK